VSSVSRLRWFVFKTRYALIGCAALAVLAAAPAAASAAPKGAFVSDQGTSQIYQLTISASQMLSYNGSVTGADGPADEAVTPNGRYLYVSDDGEYGSGSGTTVSQYSISSSGTLTPLSPPTAATGTGPVQVAVSPDGKNAYVANFVTGSLTEYSIASDGTLSLIGTLTSGYAFPEGVAVSPDGSSVYVADIDAGKIFEYDRGSNGLLTAKSPASVPFSAGAVPDLGFTPDGKYLYVSGNNGSIDEYSVGSGGQLTALPVPSVAADDLWGLIVSPNGQNVYASGGSGCGDGGGDVYQYSIGSGGELTPLTPAALSTDGCGMPWMTANGASLYAPDQAQSVYQFAVSSGGALSPKTPNAVSDSDATSLFALTIPPDQGPVAAFSEKAGKAGKATKFNASKSSDSDGTVASYHWSFGDGSSVTTTSATVSHTYKHAGKHTVTLTVTDDSGCSTTQVFTGQTAYCNGTSAATISHTVKIAAAKKSLKLSVSPKSAKAGQSTCYAFKATSKGHGVKKVSVKLAGHTATTSGSGKATLCLTLKKGTYHARASKHGYTAAVAAIRITAAAPVFTG
jgi:DNA-binding beta-propeller fold protein YncE